MSTESDSSYYAAHPPQEEPPIATQLVQRFLQLAGQLDALQAQVGRLASTMAHEREQIDVLLGHLGKETEQTDPLQERLVELTEQMSADHEQFAFLSRKLTELATQDQLVRLATVVATQRQVMDLGETIQELTRAQQRTNELTEARGRQVTDILSTVQSFLNRRSQLEEREIVMDAGRLEEIRREARGEFAALFLPAIDGLEGALEEGRGLLARHRQDLAEMNHLHGNAPGDRHTQTGPAQTGHPQAGSLVHRLRSKLAGEGETPEAAHSSQATQTPESMAAAATALNGWLRGLALVRDRFLALMAQEGIQPIQALRQPFDPRLHVIVQSEQRTDLPPNTVVREIRRGFRQDNRVLRFAEVVVARAPSGTSAP
jgi:molecular chaperone GrpE (heat shock protein)